LPKIAVIDMWFNTTKRWHKKLEPRMCAWRLKENTKAWSKIR